MNPDPASVSRTAADRPVAQARACFRAWRSIPTRWADNDVYGHVNNVVYYSWFDTAINGLLIERGLLFPDVGGPAAEPADARAATPIGLVVETGCQYFSPLSFPQTIDAGVRVARLGRTSVRYELGLFAPGATHASAQGHFVHVYVDRRTRRPASLPDALRAFLESLT